MDLANLVQHFFVPTKGELIDRIREVLLQALGMPEDVDKFLDLLGKARGVITGSLMVSAFGREKHWQGANIDCLLPFGVDSEIAKLRSFLTSVTRTAGEVLNDPRTWVGQTMQTVCIDRLMNTVYVYQCSNHQKLKLSMVHADQNPSEFIASKFDLELVRNFYSPADDVVHIGCPTSLASRRTFIDSRFTVETLERIAKYRARGFTIDFDEVAAARVYLERHAPSLEIDYGRSTRPDLLCNRACGRLGVLSIAHSHWRDSNHSITLYPNIKNPYA